MYNEPDPAKAMKRPVFPLIGKDSSDARGLPQVAMHRRQSDPSYGRRRKLRGAGRRGVTRQVPGAPYDQALDPDY